MAAPLSSDNLRRLTLLRVAALAAALTFTGLAVPVLGILPSLPVLFGLCGLWALFALGVWLRQRRHAVGEREACIHLSIDGLLLTAWLAFSGGVANPLTALYLLPVAAAAALLPPTFAWAMAGLSSIAYGLLWLVAMPITVEDANRVAELHLLGMGLTFVLSALLIVGIVGRMGAALRERDRRLAAARERALVDERIVALGSLAAGAAHALGTPLNTMTLLAEEIAANAPAAGTLGEDAQDLRLQVERCRDIVSGLLEEANVSSARNRPETLEAWMTRLLRHFRHRRPETLPVLDIPPELACRRALPEPTLSQALNDLLNNATDASADQVRLRLELRGDELIFRIQDGGPGFSAEALRHAGRTPYSGKTHGMGLGLFLTRATAERLGGRLELRNLNPGAEACLRLPLSTLLTPP
ncbi:sensor histidine kinase [Denitratisoma sp. DHT3]|uniref:sensor histidine kinase n=1 Tax=Denitratisoma sp. DHT3 TaxID=1981880 RepID=UPI0011A79E19|nr:ATP-binding protein [Denitratisoma sp. DHT3]